ncbi:MULTISPECIES: DUF2871 domain-containing protein [unclassified Microbacterium]|uniref:DUF2871 domain-containing protein n=1 Tax=unclassified Microbacterium TaxID=2609290 RepID=UPI001604C30A|nr:MULTISPECIES: DUF2871 domain-containing protein [unclassified Microbacterium]QNA93947.1 DUF2871 domain-containing protein [Microbacterium sp. Se63.02b]QYM64265.1 DUF2871 domain-containing protein [Microbacterium sp. Se5.02b]
MRRLFYAAFASMLVGVASGLFYREFTKINGFPEGESTQLGLVHTHLLVLGFVVLLIVLLLEKVFALSESRLFGWFFWTYIAGLVLTSATLFWHGCLTVLGQESSKMIAGIAGMGHILLSAGMVLLFLALRTRLSAAKPAVPADSVLA